MHLFTYNDSFLRVRHEKDAFFRSYHFHLWQKNAMRIYYIMDGSVEIDVEGKHYSVAGGDLLLFDYDEICQRYVADSCVGRSFERIVVSIRPEVFDTFDPERKLLRPFLRENHCGRNLLKPEDFPDFHWDEPLRKMVEPVPEPTGNIYSGLLTFLNDLNRKFFLVPKSSPREIRDPVIAQIVDEIDARPNELISVADLQKDWSISQTALYSRFRKAMGVSVHQYVTARHMEAARAMLEAGTPPQTVSARCGYSDYSAFYRAFRSRFGVSPCSVSKAADDDTL